MVTTCLVALFALAPGSSSPQAAQGCAFAVDTTPIFTIGDGRVPNDELFRVGTGILIGPERTVVLANRGTSQIRFIDRAGKLERAIGGAGGGPGEFRSLAGPWTVADTSLVAFDAQLQRLTIMGLDGALRGTSTLQPREGIRWPTVVGSVGGHIVAINGQTFERGEQGIGSVRTPFVFIRYSLAGILIDTLAVLAGTEFYVRPSRELTGTVRMPLGVDLLYGFVGDVMYYVDTEGARLMALSADGRRPSLVLDLRLQRPRITAADRAEFLDAASGRARGPAQQAAAKRLESVPFPERLPTLDRLMVSGTGEVWLRVHVTRDDGPTVWYVVDPRTRAFCRTTLPPRTIPLDADSATVLVLARTEDEEETVRLYRRHR